MKDKEKIKQEIERIIEEETPISKGSDYYHGVKESMEKLLQFINSLAEQKALEAYPDHPVWKVLYQEGYNQAMQDIQEFIYDKFNIHPHDCHVVQYVSDMPLESIDDLVKQFKNYMQDEM